LRKKAFLLNN